MSTTDTHYFAHLQYPAELESKWYGKYLKSFRLPLLLILTIIAVGIASYLALPKRLNPEIKIPIVTVVTIAPGSNSTDVETLVTDPLEQQISQLANISDLNSVSRENLSLITIQFTSALTPEEAQQKTKTQVEQIRLPETVQPPKVEALDFENQPVWTFALSGQTGTELSQHAQKIQELVEEVPQVNRVNLSGSPVNQISIKLDLPTINANRLNIFEINQSISTALKNLPAGTVSSHDNQFAVSVSSSIASIDQIRSLPVAINGSTIPLSSLAEVVYEPNPQANQSLISFPNQQPQDAIVISVYKNLQSDIIQTGQAAEVIVKEYLAQNPNLTSTTLLSTSDEISTQFTDLLKEFRSTIILVGVTLFIFLGLKQALISSLTVPLTFLSAFIIMNYTGQSINFLSMFAFLLSLGLLVDDTIVVVSGMTSYYRNTKFTPYQTSLVVWRDTIVPIWSTTLTTIWSFVPLLLSAGIIGEFIKPIPIVVTATMISSTAISVFITLPLMSILLKPQLAYRVKILLKIITYLLFSGFLIFTLQANPLLPIILFIYLFLTITIFLTRSYWAGIAIKLQRQPRLGSFFHRLSGFSDHHFINIEPFSRGYYRFIKKTLLSSSSRNKVVIASVVYTVACFALLPLGLVKNEFFPKADSTIVYLQIEVPSGTLNDQIKPKAPQFLNLINQFPHVEFITAEIGKTLSDVDALSNQSNTILFSIKLDEEKKREFKSYEFSEHLRQQFTNYSDQIKVLELSSGPPAGSDVQITFTGGEFAQLDKLADQTISELNTNPGITNAAKSLKPSTSQLSFQVNAQKIAELGISSQQIANSIRLLTSSSPVGELDTDDSKNIPIVLYPTNLPADIATLNQIRVSSGPQSYPLSALGTWQTSLSPISIAHTNTKRSMTVSAAVRPGYSVSDANTKILKSVKNWTFPEGYTWLTGGVNEENAKSIQSILLAMILSSLLILVTMVVQFNSFRQALIVLLVIPIAVSSVFLVFAITNTPLSFPALIGVLSLFGIVVTNSMFIVDKINLNLKEGLPFVDAIADSGASRMEPIVLTKLSTILGLLPITLADPLWRGLGGAIISGLALASIIMLLFIPVISYSWLKGNPKTN